MLHSLNSMSQHDIDSKQLDKILDSIFIKYNDSQTPGASIAILQKGKAPFIKSYGLANLEYQLKVSSTTLFNATDLAKQFTAYCILKLQDEGALSINDKLMDYIPELSSLKEHVTIRHLLEQTSGLRAINDVHQWTGYEKDDMLSREDILSWAKTQKSLNFHPGSKFQYNRTGYVLLSEVVSKVSGLTFNEYVKQHILTSLHQQVTMPNGLTISCIRRSVILPYTITCLKE